MNKIRVKYRKAVINDFKLVHRAANSLAKEYNVSVSTVYKWINQANPNNTKVLSDHERALIKENRHLREELDILKRVAGATGEELMARGRTVVL